MAKNFIEDLKEKLSPILEKIPFLAKKTEEEDEEYEDEDSEDFEEEEEEAEASKSSIVSGDRTNPKFNKIAEVESEDTEEDEEEDSEEDKIEKSQKNRKKIVQVLILLGVIYFVADELMNSPEEQVVITDPPARVKKVKTKPKEVTPEPVAEVTPEPVVEAIPEPVAEVIPEPVLEVTPEPVAVVEIDSDVLKIDEIADTTLEVPEVNLEIESKGPSFEMVEKEVSHESETVGSETSLDSQLTNIIKSVEKDNEQKKYEYTSPPNYENFGESLVYNCKGKHWACVDKQAHFQCLYNYRWAKQTGKKAECSNSKVLASAKDCRMLQLYNINMVVEVPDCN